LLGCERSEQGVQSDHRTRAAPRTLAGACNCGTRRPPVAHFLVASSAGRHPEAVDGILCRFGHFRGHAVRWPWGGATSATCPRAARLGCLTLIQR